MPTVIASGQSCIEYIILEHLEAVARVARVRKTTTADITPLASDPSDPKWTSNK